MGSFQASEGRWGIGTTLKRSKVEHNSYKFVSSGNSRHLQGEETMENGVSAKKCNQEPAGFFGLLFQGTREEEGKRSERGKYPKKMSSTC